MEKKRIAIVGSGVSGLGALYALRNTPHEVHLYEAADRLGGHTNTQPFTYYGRKTMVDTGFIVLNTATYPNFIAFLKELNVETVETEMTFGVSRDQGAFEWAGTSLDSIFAQRSNLLRPPFWRMIFDIVRFNQFALDLLSEKFQANLDLSIGEYLDQEGYSAAFRDDYLIPMTACVWSTGADKCALEFPAVTLVRFLWNHHLLNTIATRPPWLTVKNGAHSYIRTVMQSFPQEHVHLSSPVEDLQNTRDGKVVLALCHGQEEVFDDVILACHGDQAMNIISSSATDIERDIMTAFKTTPNTVYLHSDLSLMPRRPLAWSAWNYLTASSLPTSLSHKPSESKKPSDPATTSGSPSGALSKVALTYNMNFLQHIPTPSFSHVLVTMNPPHPPSPSATQAVIEYTHPLYNADAVRAQNRLHEIQGRRGVWYAGAWTGYGFHEDGFASGIKVAVEGLGGDVPWDRVDAKFMRGKVPALGIRDYLVRAFIMAITVANWLLTCLSRLAVGVQFDREKRRLKVQ